MQLQLSERVLQLLGELTAYRVVTTEQVATYLYDPKLRSKNENLTNEQIKKKKLDAVAKLFSRLNSKEFVTRNYLYSTTGIGQPHARPKSTWHITPKNIKAIRDELDRTNRADLFEVYFDDALFDRKVTNKFQQNTLSHEIGISQVFLILNTHAKAQKINAPIWINTSPIHHLFTSSVKAKLPRKKVTKKDGAFYTKELPVNPDGFFMLHDGDEYTYYFLEFDNNTETLVKKLTNKFYAYRTYGEESLFRKNVLPVLQRTYGFGLPEKARVSLRVLFVTTTKLRRDNLFIKSTLTASGGYFLFTTLDELAKDFFAPVWISNNKEIRQYVEKYWSLANPTNPGQGKARPSALRAIRDEIIAKIKKTGLIRL